MLINFFKNKWFMAILAALVLSTLFFGLGYLYAKQESPAPILIQKMNS